MFIHLSVLLKILKYQGPGAYLSLVHCKHFLGPLTEARQTENNKEQVLRRAAEETAP